MGSFRRCEMETPGSTLVHVGVVESAACGSVGGWGGLFEIRDQRSAMDQMVGHTHNVARRWLTRGQSIRV